MWCLLHHSGHRPDVSQQHPETALDVQRWRRAEGNKKTSQSIILWKAATWSCWSGAFRRTTALEILSEEASRTMQSVCSSKVVALTQDSPGEIYMQYRSFTIPVYHRRLLSPISRDFTSTRQWWNITLKISSRHGGYCFNIPAIFCLCSLCCAFLAFKIDEYNVTLEQFIDTLSPFFPEQQLQHISDFILSHEVSACYCPTLLTQH